MRKTAVKKLTVFLAVLTCVFALAGCGSSSNTDVKDEQITVSESDQQSWYQTGTTLIQTIDQAQENGIDLEQEYISQGSDSATAETIGAAQENWTESLADIGTVQDITGESVEFTPDGGQVKMDVTGSDHNAVVTISVEKSVTGNYQLSGFNCDVTYSFGEKLGQAGLNTLLGMGTTFVILILLALIITLFGKIMTGAFKRKKPEKQTSEPAPAVETAAAAPEEEAPAEEEADDTALVAVIAAAVAAYEGKTTTDGFVVRSIRKSRKKA